MRKIDINSVASRLVASAQYNLEEVCKDLADSYADLAESEIELMLLVGFELQNLLYKRIDRPVSIIVREGDQFSFDDAYMIIRPQFQWERYRIDFRIDVANLGYPVFVECDGHDFHERTKEQAERDRSRDRAIQAANIPIIRFTGREIYRDPLDCVTQICRFLVDRFDSKPA